MPIKYLHIIERVDDSYGGPAKSIPLLCNMLCHEGIENLILSVNEKHEKNEYIERFKITWIKSKPTYGRYFSVQYIFDLFRLVKHADVVHLHSCWSFPSLLFIVLSFFTKNKKIFFSPRSSLEPKSLQKKHILKSILRKILINRFVRNSDAVFCSSEYEKNGLQAIYPGLKNVETLPNNIDLCFRADYDKNTARQYLNLPIDKKIIAFISRIHSRKRLDFLVDLWIKLVCNGFPDLHLLIAGHIDEPIYFNSILEKIKLTAHVDKFHYIGSVSGDERLQYFTAVDLFVLPSRFESFGMAIAESLTAGTPVLVTNTTPWHDINNANCGWCVEIDEFEKTIKNFLLLDDAAIEVVSENAKKYIDKNYSHENSIEILLKHLS